MTEQEKRDYWFKWHKFQQRYEGLYFGKLKKALNLQVDQYIEARNVDNVKSYPIYDVLTDLYKTVGVNWANKVRLDLSATKSLPMGFHDKIVELMKIYYGIDLLNDAENITQTTREYIAEVLQDAAVKGLSFDDIVRALKSPELTAKRARLIARTETVTAANGAAMVYVKTSPGQKLKTWIAVRDKRTRHSHREVDNVTLDIDTPFDVNAALMQQPGVRTLENGMPTPAAEVCNCRCTVAFRNKRDADGRLIL